MEAELDPNGNSEGNKNPGSEGQEATPNYGGFETPEELASAYEESSQKMDSLKTQIADLERIKGDNRGAISQLRNQVATLSGKLDGMQQSAPQQPVNQGPTLDQITAALERGQIDDGRAISLAVQATEQSVKTALTQSYKDDLKRELDAFRSDLDQQNSIREFVNKNPGYVEAYEAGKLDPWLTVDHMTGEKSGGEEAWREYQLHTAQEELKALKEESKQNRDKAKKSGVDEGLELAKSKKGAARVLDGKGGQFSQTAGNYDLGTSKGRAQAGASYLKQLRSG